MAKYKSNDLLDESSNDVRRLMDAAAFLQQTDAVKLAYTTDEKKWSVVQILEHLNAYNRHYLPVNDKELPVLPLQHNAWFSSGYWGEKFTKAMKPTTVYQIRNKMKAMKAYTFANGLHVETVLGEFLAHQKHLLQLLDRAGSSDLNAIRIPTTLTTLLKLKLGDLFRFLIAHEQRHLVQARNMLKEVGVTTEKFPAILQASKL